MSGTHFAGPVTSPGGFVGAVTGAVTGNVTGNLTPTVLAATHGAGVIGTSSFGAPRTYRWSENGTIITEIKIDLTGLASVATANDVICLAAGGAAYLAQYTIALFGVLYKVQMACLETPAGGDNDINLVGNASGTLTTSGAGGTAYGINGGDQAAGMVVENLVPGLTANHYLYLTAGTGDTAAAYTAGQLLIRFFGHAVLA